MTMRRGRCTNVELCSMATTQRVIEIPQGEPFICTRCSSDLAPVVARKKNAGLRAVQIGAVVLGVAGIGAKVYLDNRPKPPAPPMAASEPPPTVSVQNASMLVAAPPAAPAPTAASPAAAPPVEVTPFLRLAGSDVIANGAARRLAAGYLALIGDTEIHTQPGSQPGVTQIVGMQAGAPEAISITTGGTTAGFSALAQGQADITLALRPVSPAEAKSMAAIGDLTSADAEHVAGVDAVAVVANPSIRVASLSRAQVQAIYAGKITNWSELGAPAGEIHAYIAGGQSDTLLFPDPAQASAGKAEEDGAAVLAAVAGDIGAIGLLAARDTGSLRVLPISDSGAAVAPTDATIANGDYPLTRRAVFYGVRSAAHGAVRRFTDYVASPAGQMAVQAAGFVPAIEKADSHPTPIAGSDRFKRFVAGATPLPIVLHFEQSSVQLDRNGFRDVDRLAAYMRSHHIDGDKLILAGFSDNAGSAAIKESAAQKRVASVTTALARVGITPARAAGFGAEVPVADDSTSDGRDKNRRVEVYVIQ